MIRPKDLEGADSGGKKRTEFAETTHPTMGKVFQKNSLKMGFEKTFQIRVRYFTLSLGFHSLNGLGKQDGSALDPSPRPGISFTKNG